MAGSQLLVMFKALEGVVLSQRTQGAVVKHAYYIANNSGGDSTDIAFALMVLDNPLQMWQEMLIEVAANGTIQDNLSIDPSGNIDDREVPDTDIEYVVGSSWHKVATKVIQPTV